MPGDDHAGALRMPSPATVAEYVYTVLLRPSPLRAITNATIRALLPRTVTSGPATVVLNPRDPVVSGALALSLYEPLERAFVESNCTEGALFVDVGANVGLYTALAAHYVGERGSVLALEPDPVSLRFLERTIALNYPDRVELRAVAATEHSEQRTLFASPSNRGDNRLTPHESGSEAIEVRGETLDHLLSDVDLVDRHLFLKIDVQGSEGEVLRGAQSSLSAASSVTLLMEFWTEGLRRAGSDPVELLDGLRQLGFELAELSGGTSLSPITDLRGFEERYPGRRYTNVVARRGVPLAGSEATGVGQAA